MLKVVRDRYLCGIKHKLLLSDFPMEYFYLFLKPYLANVLYKTSLVSLFLYLRNSNFQQNKYHYLLYKPRSM